MSNPFDKPKVPPPKDYEAILAAEGMPAELEPEISKMKRENPELADIFEEDTAEGMIRQYALKRALSQMSSQEGEHQLLARVANSMDPSIGVDEWEDYIKRALESRGKRRF